MADYVHVPLDEFDPEIIEKAFWLQEHIRREGIDGIHYMFHARSEARTRGPNVVADNISHELKQI